MARNGVGEAPFYNTHSVKGLEGRRGTTDFQVGYVGRMGEHPGVGRSRIDGTLFKES